VSDEPQYQTKTYDQIANELQTGDIFLFHGTSNESKWIEWATGSMFSHVGMVALHPKNKKPMIWQTGPDPITWDPETGTQHGGAQCGWLKDTLTLMASHKYGDAPYWRQLDVERGKAFEDAVIHVVSELEGTPFPDTAKMIEESLEGQLYIEAPQNNLFCAELVALMYQKMGLLPQKDPPDNWYDPKRFSEEYDKLPMLKGKLGTTYQVSMGG